MQYYHVSDYRALSPYAAARLFFYLPNDSRIKMILSGQKLTLDQTLMAVIADRLGFLAWAQTADGQKNRNRPKSILEALQGQTDTEKEDIMAFDTPAEFEAMFQKLTHGGGIDGS